VVKKNQVNEVASLQVFDRSAPYGEHFSGPSSGRQMKSDNGGALIGLPTIHGPPFTVCIRLSFAEQRESLRMDFGTNGSLLVAF
jgi:hypothetical protein